MQISVQQIFNKLNKSNKEIFTKGFTFLETLIVLTLTILIIGYATPNFLRIFSNPHETEFNHITRVLKILRNDAILKHNSYCIIFDLKQQKMLTTNQDKNGECIEEFLTKPKILEPHAFEENLYLQEATLSEKSFFSNENYSENLIIHINSSGFVTPFKLKFSLMDFSKSWQIESVGIMGDLILKETSS